MNKRRKLAKIRRRADHVGGHTLREGRGELADQRTSDVAQQQYSHQQTL